MKLDERIVLLTDIITCFNIEKAKSFIGQKGYFADIISSYQNLGNITYGTLTEIKDNDYPFEEDNHECWRFFIPEIRLKPVEKVFRPCTLDEFGLHIGDLIRFRRKENHNIEICTMYMGYVKTNSIVKVILGGYYYSFEELFEDYEWFDKDSNTWEPFGVEK